MCLNCMSPEERERVVRYYEWPGEEISLRPREEVYKKLLTTISPDEFDLSLKDGEYYVLFGVDFKYYAIAILTKKQGE